MGTSMSLFNLPVRRVLTVSLPLMLLGGCEYHHRHDEHDREVIVEERHGDRDHHDDRDRHIDRDRHDDRDK